MRAAFRDVYGEDAPLALPLTLHSWMGGDRDGNPNVTAEVTRETFTLHRERACALLTGEIDFTDNFSGLLRVGLYNAQLDYSESGTSADNSPHYYSHSDDTTKLTYGLGLNVRVNPSWDVRLDWDRYTDVGRRFALSENTNGRFEHIDFVSLNLAYRFGQ